MDNTNFQYLIACNNGQDFLLQLNITSISRSCKHHNFPIQKFPAEYFNTNGEHPRIHYCNEVYNKFHIETELPIIISPIGFSLQDEYIVIDGNHRISAKLANKHPYISGIVYIPINTSDFLSPLNWAFYLFFMEIRSFCVEVLNGIPFSTLYPKSNIFSAFLPLIQ